jgi:hypothetical protein
LGSSREESGMTEYVSGELVENLREQVSYLEAAHTPIKTEPAEPAEPAEPVRSEPREAAEPPGERPGFWSRLFGRGG